MISDYFNTINEIELPITEALQKEFTIHLSSDVYVSDVDQDWKETNEALLIRGAGFHSQKSGLINKVFFKDNSAFSPEEAFINEAWDDLISVNVPRALDLDYVSIGKTFFYVELEDGSQSNEFPLAIVPSPVTASVRGDITTPGSIYKGQKVTLRQSSSVPIYYSLNGTAEQRYVAPIELIKTSSLMAYAKQEIGGINYRSRIARFEYKTCAEGETYIPYPHGAACVVIQNQSLMPNRYCPINSRDYSGSLYTEHYEVSCLYEQTKLKLERHLITVPSETTGTQRIAIHSTTFWTEPEGRPMVVALGQGRYYNFCPNGSFWLPGQSCSH